jgi:hypothetical protein
MTALALLARGEADDFEKPLFDKQAVNTVRYADHAAWVVATATARAFAAARDAVTAADDRVGVIATSARGPVETMGWVGNAAREGYSSPLRYPATNPGSLAGVTCILLGLRGPTLVLTMPTASGAPLATALGGSWIARGDVPLVVTAASWERAPGKHAARCVLLGAASAGPAYDAMVDGAWLAATEAGSKLG